MANRKFEYSILSGLLMVWLFASIAYADDVEDSVKEAMQFYQEGDFTAAVETLDYAAELIKKKKGLVLMSFLPAAMDGWTSEDVEAQGGGGMFGGGVSATRKYHKGSAAIKVSIITDSPLMQGMMMMFTNPMFAAQDGGKLERIERQKAIVKYDPKRQAGDIKIIVGNRYFVTIEGNGVTQDELIAYAEAIDYKKLSVLV